MVKVIKARTLEEAFDLSPDECVVDPQYEVEMVELKEKRGVRAKVASPSATKTLAPE